MGKCRWKCPRNRKHYVGRPNAESRHPSMPWRDVSVLGRVCERKRGEPRLARISSLAAAPCPGHDAVSSPSQLVQSPLGRAAQSLASQPPKKVPKLAFVCAASNRYSGRTRARAHGGHESPTPPARGEARLEGASARRRAPATYFCVRAGA